MKNMIRSTSITMVSFPQVKPNLLKKTLMEMEFIPPIQNIIMKLKIGMMGFISGIKLSRPALDSINMNRKTILKN